jgi:hypothetical protein
MTEKEFLEEEDRDNLIVILIMLGLVILYFYE